ncbi:hypothetical protein OK349_01920 [Sphingomonas sp. BT-65]|uniref:hypothetical protein n=1 Tax=Sphingomonas sp. BT-65 TaxID=2989821 RepID=UPI002235E017|nr:hypothetical protein [Sphingomonas sp. BT-65]MCW4460448.1 hypothetical protein [Sphingomonas sp. BT-65]
MADFKRFSLILMTSVAATTLASCDGATSIATPGGGNVIVNPPAPAPSPSPSPTPTPITAAQFAGTGGQVDAAFTITADEQLALATTAPGTNNNVNGTRVYAAGSGPVVASPTISPLTTTPTVTDPTTLNTGGSTFFTAGSFLGAFSGPADTAFQQWTCNSPSANFGAGSASCNAPPLVVAAGATPAASACPTGTTDGGTNTNVRLCRLPNSITANLTLPRITGVAYLLDGNVEVGTDVGTTGAATGPTLTIEPGVTIVANPADAANDVLLVNRGAKIDAVGTAALPIIFTSRQNLSATGTSDSTQGQWGGVILLGQAPTGVCRTGTGPNNADGTSTTCDNTAEGLATTRLYGGPDKASNSGRMAYVQIRFTGIDISAGGGNELQGLTLGGVGSGTQLDHIQSHNSADDGIEVFGGTTNLKYVAITGADDDGFDYDNGYRGLVQFLLVAQKPGGATSDSFMLEVDSNGNEDLLPRTYAQIANFTFIHTAATTGTLRIRGGADGRFVNGLVQSSVPCLNVIAGTADRSTFRAAGQGPTINGGPQENGPPIFTSVYFACSNR